MSSIKDLNGNTIEEMQALHGVVLALDKKFSDGSNIYQRVSRLCEEAGELASAVNHIEGMGVKTQKHGEATTENLVKELQDVMRATIGIAHHYGLEDDLRLSIQNAYHYYQRENYL